ncbi:hypothetical protein ACJJTC_001355 [Scirpophaga incertulas]
MRKRKLRPKSQHIDISKADRSLNIFVDNELHYCCYVCKETFDTNEECQKHVLDCKKENGNIPYDPTRVCFVEKRIKCEECPKLFKFKKNYLKHCNNEHSKAPDSVSCTQCHVRCPNEKMLAEHIEETHNRTVYECEHCGKRFVRRAHVLRHMSQIGCDGSNISVYPCDICGAKFTRKDNLVVHLRYQHILRNVFTCKHCTYGTKNLSKLIKHWQETHLHPAKYECDICGKATSSRTSIAKHLEIHGEKKYTCEVCGYKTYTAEVMKRHVLTHIKDKPHKCELCAQSFIQRLQLMRHIEKHTGNVCGECGMAFNSKARLIIHERAHLGLKRLSCPFDDCVYSKKEFSTQAALQTHVKGHLVKKEVKCEVCNKGFHSEVNMRRHLSTHRLDKPRRCMYCLTARAYIRGEQLLRHVRRQHSDIFRQHLSHVRRVLGTNMKVDRVSKSELESILNVLDAESERIIQGYSGADVLYGGVQEQDTATSYEEIHIKSEESPLMSEEELEENLERLLTQLIDKEVLECFGWPEESVDNVLRENAKHLFLYAVEDKHVARMLDTHTIDQVIKHILAQVGTTDPTTTTTRNVDGFCSHVVEVTMYLQFAVSSKETSFEDTANCLESKTLYANYNRDITMQQRHAFRPLRECVSVTFFIYGLS